MGSTESSCTCTGWWFLGGYVLTSFVLLKNPTLLHKKKKTKFTCVHISHRGGRHALYVPVYVRVCISMAIHIETLFSIVLPNRFHV